MDPEVSTKPAASGTPSASRTPRLRLPQTAFDRLAQRSLTSPGRTALVDAQRCWSYTDAFDAVCGLIRLLAVAGVGAGERVAVIVDDPMHHLLLLLACEGLAAASGSLSPSEAKDNSPLLEHFDHVIADKTTLDGVHPTLIVDGSWFRSSPAHPSPAPALRHAPDDCVRIALASGSTRRPQLVSLTRRMVRDRVGAMASACQLSEGAIDWLVTPLSVPIAYVRALAVLAVGGTVAFGTKTGMVRPAKVTHLLAAPSFLESLIDLSQSWRASERLAVSVFGAQLPMMDRKQLLATTARSIRCFYGTTETGLVCEIGRDGVGWSLPDIEVKVVNEETRPTAEEWVGRIAVRSAGVVTSYLGNDTMTRRHFRDGWFITQDRGLIEGEHLYLSRRDDEMLNIGGHKVQPEIIEALCLQHPDVTDACACHLRTPEGRDTLALGVVLSPQAAPERVGKSLLELMPPWVRSARIGYLSALQRGARGEALREQLRHVLNASGTRLDRVT